MILIADDEASVRRLVAALLRAHGYRTLEAQNGLEAAYVYGSHYQQIALVVTDLEMPVMGGLEALERMQAINPAVRVVVISGCAAGLKQAAPAIACWLEKPFTPRQLLDSVELALHA